MSAFRQNRIPDLCRARQAIAEALSSQDSCGPLLVGISGVDGSGKGYVTGQIERALLADGLRVVSLNVDPWLNLPDIRFDAQRPAQNFYERGLRLDDFLSRVVIPLREQGKLNIEFDALAETASEFQRSRICIEEVDVVLVEGIFLFKHGYQDHFDLRIWIDCTLETALQRAIVRAQEALPEAETVAAYHTIYFPAQHIHFARDYPRASADVILFNDPRMFSATGHPAAK